MIQMNYGFIFYLLKLVGSRRGIKFQTLDAIKEATAGIIAESNKPIPLPFCLIRRFLLFSFEFSKFATNLKFFSLAAKVDFNLLYFSGPGQNQYRWNCTPNEKENKILQ